MEEIIKTLSFSSIAWQVITPLIFSGLDILTGYIQAVINKNVDSKVMREGLLHKCLLIVAIIIGYVIEYAFNLPAVAQVITIYICVMEVVSILENLKKAGLDLGKLGDILKNKKEE
jgi:toxin secretion/phage lysis holin